MKIQLKHKKRFSFYKWRPKQAAFALCFALLFLGNTASWAQEKGQAAYQTSTIEERAIDAKNWQNATAELDYEQFRKKEKEEDTTNNNRTENSAEPFDMDFNTSIFDGDWSGFFQVFFFVLVIGLLAFLTLKLMGATAFLSNKKIDKTALNYSIEKIEANLHQADLEGFVNQAVQNGDYKLAIRLYYLQIIKKLSLQKWIKWKKDKTNNAYLNEMRGSGSFKEFRAVTRLFERVWYGDVRIDASDFEVLRPQFLAFLKNIGEKTGINV